jgi:hypothetical protein
MEKSLGEANAGSVEAQQRFKLVGLDLAELSHMRPEQAYLRTIDALKSIPSPADRAAASMAIFGKSSGELMGIISRGSSGFAQFQESIKKTGQYLSDLEARELTQTAITMKQLDRQLQGFVNRATVSMAPSIATGSTFFAPLAAGFFSQYGALFNLASHAAETFIPGVATANEKFHNDAARTLAQQRSEQAAKLREGSESVLAQGRLKADIEGLTSSLQGQLATAGKSAAALKLYELAQRGASAEQLRGAAALAKQVEAGHFLDVLGRRVSWPRSKPESEPAG